MGSTASERSGVSSDWSTFRERLLYDRALGFWLDTSRLGYDSVYLDRMESRMQSAFDAMEQLEAGGTANPDENRMVGHYWLRSPERAPSVEIKQAITSTLAKICTFAAGVHSGAIAPKAGGRFTHVLVIGIGGSALGPQFVYQALGSATDSMKLSFFDNTDPDGMNRVLYELRDPASTLVIVTSKSGGTKETRNGQYVAKAAFQKAGLDFRRHFVAVTGEGSELDATAIAEGWLERFPMWDWVGGRTSEFSAVGLLPLALQGVDIDEVLRGAAAMDALTRSRHTRSNPAAILALSWYHCGCGKGNKDMVVLPYKDRLELFSKYLQQLVMESLGKELDRNGEVVHQGLAVYGNKGSTDQHAYVQQLREGIHNFFVVFIEVLRDRAQQTKGAGACAAFNAEALEVEPGITSGDYLSGFYLGTRAALTEKKRESITVGVSDVSPHSVGMLIALFERAVGLYASLVNVNAYHQPGVEAGKKAAAEVLKLQERVMKFLQAEKGRGTAEQIAKAIGEDQRTETVFHILRHLAENERVLVEHGVAVFEDSYSMK
jgi:glucose-6-phosphate isomerase